MYDVIIIGGGLAGLSSSIRLAQAGFSVLVIERKTYPFHRVCGEYVSNEVRPYLENLGLNLEGLGIKTINRFLFSAPSGRSLQTTLDLGGFGISRYRLDFELYLLAQKAGVVFLLGETVENIAPPQKEPYWEVNTSSHASLKAKIALGAFGKNSRLDKVLDRDFTLQKSPYVGVKYHLKTDFPQDLIALHNFRDGYCGISAIEEDKYCLCYLTTRQNLRQYGDIKTMEQQVLWQNPHLKRIFNESAFLYPRPEVINEFSFASKKLIENHLLMVGDAAGLITPLCGNGMAMALHGGKIAADLTADFLNHKMPFRQLETQYQKEWKRQFATRLWVGRQVQRLFGDVWLSELTLHFFSAFRPLLKILIKNTHGQVIE
ncbi:MAG: NAD(P)/FAD-dependent oxidoreductase [Runella sp.]